VRQWLREHSLTVVLGILAFALISASAAYFDTWREFGRDTLNGLGVGAFATCLIVWAKKFFVERGKHPSPESK
jgi:hypothetical protein